MKLKLKRREVHAIIDAVLFCFTVQGLLMIFIVVLLMSQYKSVIQALTNQKPAICIQVGDGFESVTVEEIINE